MGFPTPEQVAVMQAHITDDRRPPYIILTSVFLVLGTISFCLRFVSRYVGGVNLGVDDYLMMIGFFLTAAYCSMLFLLLRWGMGYHVILVTDPRALTIALITAEVLYAVAICFIKLSILGLYNRLFPQVWFRRASIGVGIFIIMYTITKINGDIFQCVPISSHWDPTVKATCIEFSKLVIVHGSLNILTDFIIFALPMPVLWNLNLGTAKKWALSLVLTIGAFVCIISVVRLPIVKEVDTVDPSWDFVWPLGISALELNSAVIAACIPTYRALFNAVVYGDPRHETGPSSGYVGSREPRSSFTNDTLPLSDLDTFKTDHIPLESEIHPSPPASQRSDNQNLSSHDHQQLNGNQILVTRSFTSKTSPLQEKPSASSFA